MATEKRMIDANKALVVAQRIYSDPVLVHAILNTLNETPTVAAVEVDAVIEMFEYMLGDCPCNFSPVDEWLAERCELQNECPNPKDKRGCWKQFIKHFIAEMDGDGNA